MTWRADKQQARDIVHATMGYPCTYVFQSLTIADCVARHHRSTAFIGSDDEFAPGLLSQINRVIIDLREVPEPKRTATLTFTDTGEVVVLMTFTPQGEHYVMCEVIPG